MEKRKINDYCDKPGVTWCQDGQILFCWQIPSKPTGVGLIRGTGVTCEKTK